MTSRTPATTVRIPANVSQILVVEGNEDKTFFQALADHLGINDQLYIVVCEGKSELSTTLASLLNDGNFHNLRHIGIICDNDFPDVRQGKSTMQVVQEEVDEANDRIDESLKSTRQLPRPRKPRVPEGTKPKVSVLLLPDDNRDGMVENLVLDAIGEDNITNCVDAYYACLEQHAQLKIQEAREPRSRLSVYISGKILDSNYATNDDSRRWFLTQAVDMKWWKDEKMWDKPQFKPAISFLHQLLAD